MTDIVVYLQALKEAAESWDDRSDELDTALTSLSGIDTSLLGDRVKGHADAFLSTWTTETARLVSDAADHAQALRDNATYVAAADAAVVEAMQQLLPWDQRSMDPRSAR